jgi:hypothetical protein
MDAKFKTLAADLGLDQPDPFSKVAAGVGSHQRLSTAHVPHSQVQIGSIGVVVLLPCQRGFPGRDRRALRPGVTDAVSYRLTVRDRGLEDTAT